MLFIFCRRKFIPALFILPPVGEIAVLHINAFSVQHKHMVDTAIQQVTVMGNENEAVFLCKVSLYSFTGGAVEMVSRFIYQQKIILTCEQDRKEDLSAFAVAESMKRTVKQFRIFIKLSEFAYYLPFLAVGLDIGKEFRSREFHILIGNGVGEIAESDGSGNRTTERIFSHKDVQESSFPLAVSADEAQLPVCINGKGDILENIIEAPLVVKSKIVDAYL